VNRIHYGDAYDRTADMPKTLSVSAFH